MRVDEQKRLIDSVLSDWPVSRRKSVQVEFGNRRVRVFLHDPVCGFVSGMSCCHPFDVYNDVSGLIYALARLRVRFAYKEFQRSLKTWVPKDGEVYYVPGLHYNGSGGAQRFLTCQSCPRIWCGDADDYMYLAAGFVFRTLAEAKKCSRFLWFEGRRIANLVKRHSVNKKCLTEKERSDVASPLVLDDLPSDWSGFGVMDELTNSFSGCDCEVKDSSCACGDVNELEFLCGEEGANPVADGFWEDGESIVGPVLKSGQRYFMDPVTGEMFISESGV